MFACQPSQIQAKAKSRGSSPVAFAACGRKKAGSGQHRPRHPFVPPRTFAESPVSHRTTQPQPPPQPLLPPVGPLLSLPPWLPRAPPPSPLDLPSCPLYTHAACPTAFSHASLACPWLPPPCPSFCRLACPPRAPPLGKGRQAKPRQTQPAPLPLPHPPLLDALQLSHSLCPNPPRWQWKTEGPVP